MRVSGETIKEHLVNRKECVERYNESTANAVYLSISPFVPEKTQFEGYPVSLSYGLTYAGYDVRLDKICPKSGIRHWAKPGTVSTPLYADRNNPLLWVNRTDVSWIDYSKIWSEPVSEYVLQPGEFCIGSLMEYINVPNTMDAGLKDKSTLARLGLQVQNTVIEPGWRGYLTVEIVNQSHVPIPLMRGMPIGQMQFTLLDHPIEKGYDGKYQGQDAHPIPAR